VIFVLKNGRPNRERREFQHEDREETKRTKKKAFKIASLSLVMTRKLSLASR